MSNYVVVYVSMHQSYNKPFSQFHTLIQVKLPSHYKVKFPIHSNHKETL